MAKWKEDPQGRDFVEEVSESMELPIYNASAKGKFRPWLKETWNKIENKDIAQDETIKGISDNVDKIQIDLDTKQDKQDNALQTDAKEIVPAINEIKELAGNGGEKVPIGSIVPFASDIIPLGYLLCDGREIKRNDYPELFALLKDKNGKRYLPDLRNQFIRGNSGDRELLSEQGDAIRNITGKMTAGSYGLYVDSEGCFTLDKNHSYAYANSNSRGYGTPIFDASLVVPTADENRPVNVSVNFMIKAINVKQESIDELAIDELNKKIETNKVAINNHEYEVQQEFNKRDEVVTLYENPSPLTTLTVSEEVDNFESLVIEIKAGNAGTLVVTLRTKLLKYSNGTDARQGYYFPGTESICQVIFRTNKLNVYQRGSLFITKITGIGRLK